MRGYKEKDEGEKEGRKQRESADVFREEEGASVFACVS